MKARLLSPALRIAVALVLVAGLCSFGLSARAQEAAAKGADSAKPTPRTPDGHPDLTGFWGNPYGNFFLAKQGNRSIAGLGISKTGPKAFEPGGDDPLDPARRQQRLDQFVGPNSGPGRRARDPNQPPYKPELLAK